MRWHRLILTIAVSVVFAILASAQSSEVVFEHITVDDGLPQNSARAIIQDHLGFMWFATQAGLVKFDGYDYTTYQHDQSDSTSISRGDIFVLHEDRKGSIWIGTGADGLNRFDRDTETFTHFRHDSENPNSISGNWIGFIHEDQKGTIWLQTQKGPRAHQFLDRMDPETGIVVRYRHDPDDPGSLSAGRLAWFGIGPFATAFLEDRQGTIWIGKQNSGLNRFNPETGSFDHFVHDPDDASSLSNNFVNDIFEDSSGHLWVATDGGLNLMNRIAGTFTVYPPPQDVPLLLGTRLVHEDHVGNLWVGTRGGMVRFEPKTGVFQRYVHDPRDQNNPGHSVLPIPFLEDQSGDIWFTTSTRRGAILNRLDQAAGRLSYFLPDTNTPTSISLGRIESIVEDRSGVVWIGTWGGGVNKFARSNHKFLSFQHDPADSNSLSSNRVEAISEDRQGLIWIGTSGGGLDRMDRMTGRFTHYIHDPDDENSISDNRVNSVLVDSEDEVWVGTQNGLNRFVSSSNGFIRYTHHEDDPNSLVSNNIQVVYEDRSGRLWVGTQSNPNESEQMGIHRFDRETEKFTHYQYQPFSPPDNFVYSIREDLDHTLWIGTNLGGLQRFDYSSGAFTSYRSSFIRSSVTAIFEDSSSRLWVGSANDGFGNFDKQSGTGKLFTVVDGLDNNGVFSILEDENQRLWLGTGRGLTTFDPVTTTFNSYDVSDGLPGNSFTRAAYKASDGSLLFGGESGLVVFHSDRIRDNPNPPIVALTGFRLFDKLVSPGEKSPLTTSVSESESIKLRHDQNDFSFEYSAVHYVSPAKNRYAYKLDNYDDAWRFVGSRRDASYMNLSPGSYTFRVKASNNDDLWNEEGISIRVIVLSPWWKTAWAYIVYGLLFIGGVVAVDRVQRKRLLRNEHEKARIRSAEERSEMLAELDSLKTRFFVDISHEFRTPLTLILGPLRDGLDGAFGNLNSLLTSQFELMQSNGVRLLRLISQLLDLAKLEAGSLRLRARKSDLVTVIRRVVGLFASRAERTGITLEFITSDDELLLYFEEEKLERILLNLLSNAFKFTDIDGRICVELRAGDEPDVGTVDVLVSDTGCGISPNELPFVFDRYHQIDRPSGANRDGTGIGLALVKELVSLHGGTVTVNSEVGKGTIFVIQLLRGRNHLAVADIEETDSPVTTGVDNELDLDRSVTEADIILESASDMLEEPPSRNAPTVLIVEDNADIRSYLRTQLRSRYRVVVARDGAEGLEKAREIEPALVISDVMMPRMDGFELCKKLKSDRVLGHIPVVLLTARADDQSKVEGLEYGADDYISKPFSSTELLVRAENLIEIRRLLRQRFSGEWVVGPGELTIPSADASFLDRVKAIIEENMANSNFSVDWLAGETGVSTRKLQRRLKQLLNLSPGGYIRTMRLQRAAQMLEKGVGNVSEVAYAVGFQDLKHFSGLFKQVFGVVPSKYGSTKS